MPELPQPWRSPLRGPRLTSILGSMLLVLVGVVAVTGFLSHAAYNPYLGHNAVIPRGQDFKPFTFTWPASPSWLYALNQGLHVTVGIVAVPLLLAKLWSVIPRLFEFPPVRSVAHLFERVTALALVGGAIFQFGTGIFDVQLYYPWHFNFVEAHYYGAWVFCSALVLHVGTKFPVMVKAFRTRRELLEGPGGLVAPDPAPPTISRRGFLGGVGAAMGGMFILTAGQSIGGPLRKAALLAPRGGGDDFPVNKTAAFAKVGRVDASWRLKLVVNGRHVVSLSRAELLALPQRSYDLPIACVEGWSTTQRWSGVRLADLARHAGAPNASQVQVESLQPAGAFRQTTLAANELHAEQSLLALSVNGAELPLDHGFPARIIVPALPGVHNTKWVGEMRFT
ncbi:MAG: molybdopterin-dependent oxidoreductase [Solirubrobacterales bacterium]|nr:molybdopterin-dependent oxidoreductase [Solirubrobacterales bacterium]